MAKISVFIITKNEEKRIARAINSIIEVADEIIVIDSGSTDNTVQICKDLGASVIFNEWPGYVKQKAFGENLCKNEWVLNLDADEELSADLQNEINYIFKANIQDRYHAYQINFVIMHRLDVKPRRFAPANKFVRLYNRKFASFSLTKNSTTHDLVMFKQNINAEKQIYDFNEIAYHYSAISIEQLVAKSNFYSTEQAKDLVNNNKIPSKIRVVFELFWFFFKAFFIRRYFVFGYSGFVDSLIFAFARFLRLAKAREMRDKNKIIAE